MLHRINAEGTIDPDSEMHYRFHHKIDPAIYPQVHDFYELTLVTSGCMRITVNGQPQELSAGTLMLIRPGDVHARQAMGECHHINVAFPARVVTGMFQYLEEPGMLARILEGDRPPTLLLTAGNRLLLQTQLETLNLLPVSQPRAVCTALRRLMLDVMLEYILPTLSGPQAMACPDWFRLLLEQLDSPECFSWNLSDLERFSGRTREHLCRSFQKYLGVSPIACLSAKRLNYAANLLLHSDQKIIDVAYAAGFQSLSRFYHLFKREFGVSPMQYRRGEKPVQPASNSRKYRP